MVLLMKKILGIVVLSFLISNNALTMDDSDLADLAGDAQTDLGARVIYEYCDGERSKKTFRWQYGDDCKCALKAGDSKNEIGVRLVIEACGL